MVIIIIIASFFTLMVFHWGLSDSKSPQVSGPNKCCCLDELDSSFGFLLF